MRLPLGCAAHELPYDTRLRSQHFPIEAVEVTLRVYPVSGTPSVSLNGHRTSTICLTS